MQQLGDEAIVSVRDNGIGISTEMLSHVFDMFTQIDGNLAQSKGGLGIGLFIVKRLVEMHGGSIEVCSGGAGSGSEFIVRLPVASSLPRVAPHEYPARHPAARRRILVVDDNVDAAETLAMVLTMMGNETVTAHDGLTALKLAATYGPDVIFLDIGMPELNGYEVSGRIRQQEWGKNIVLIALTGWGQEEDKRRSLEAGFNIHLTKPILPAEIAKLLEG
jgi:CheY-like chemotaxis protein